MHHHLAGQTCTITWQPGAGRSELVTSEVLRSELVTRELVTSGVVEAELVTSELVTSGVVKRSVGPCDAFFFLHCLGTPGNEYT